MAQEQIGLPASLSNAIRDSQIRTSPIEATVDSVAEIEKVVSPEALSVIPDEILLPSPFPPPFNIILGTEKSDFLVGSLGANDAFNDLIIGFGGNDTILGLEGEDTLLGGEGNDLLYGGPESVFRSSVILPFFGDDDLLFGEDGNDRLIGGRGNDLFNGGSGSDQADYTNLGQAITLKAQGVVDKGRLGQDQIVDIETIVGAKGKKNAIDGSEDNGVTSFDINLSQNRLVVQDIPGLGDVKFTVNRFFDVTGTNQDDQIVGNNSRNNLAGGGGNDTISGLGGNDRFIGGQGNDVFNGGSGSDQANYTDLGQAITLKNEGVVDKGRLGQDQIVDIETILGARGQRNAIDGSEDNGVTSFDINLSQNRLVVQDIPELGDVKFTVRRFLDVTGTNQDDQIVGNNRRNNLTGGGGNDTISGLGGNDTINGVDPFSTRPGFNEIDNLSGGAGKDTFVVGDNESSYYLGGGFFGLNDFAYIEDFQKGQDKIQLKKGNNYIFGDNFIAIGNQFDFRTVDTFDNLTKGLDADGVLNLGSSLQSTLQANSALSLDGTSNAESLTILPNFDLVAIVNTSYSQKDLVFV